MRRATVVLGVLLILSMASTSRAALLAYDGFSGSGPLLGQDDGLGFAGPWYPWGYNATRPDIYSMADGSLSYSDLLTSDGRVEASYLTNQLGGIGRQLAQPLGTDGTTRYVSVLLRPEGILNQGIYNGFFGLYLGGNNNFGPDVFFGKPGGGAIGQYVLENRGGDVFQIPTASDVVVDETALLVLKAEFSGGGETFTLYANPPLGSPEPSSGATEQGFNIGPISNLVIYSTGQFSIDEIRVGTTYADVMPVPEPSTLGLLGATVATALIWVWRRRMSPKVC